MVSLCAKFTMYMFLHPHSRVKNWETNSVNSHKQGNTGGAKGINRRKYQQRFVSSASEQTELCSC
jgi:hypothetical protein